MPGPDGKLREHPRLLATAADFDRIREMTRHDERAGCWLRHLREAGKKIVDEPVSKYEIPDGKRLLATSRRVLARVETLGMLWQLERDSQCIERIWAELEAAASFPDWNPSHFLDTAEMTRAFATAYDWLYESWDQKQRQLIARTIIEKGMEPALAAYDGADWGWWVKVTHNWNIVCNGGVTMGALAIGDQYPEIASKALERGLKSVRLAIGRFAPDGGWDEGVGYWHYSIRYLVPYLASLQTALGTDYGLGDTPGISESGYFPLYLTGTSEQSFNFADCHAGALRAPELHWLAQRYNRPEYAWWQLRAAGDMGSARDLLWYDPKMCSKDSTDLPLDRYFRKVEVVSFRSSWEDRDGLFFAFKAGDNRANHGDLDIGSFVFDALGVRWAEDLGGDDYNLPGYFGSDRWMYYRKRAEGHNTLVIGAGAGPDQDPGAVAKVDYVASRPDEALAIADLTPAYRDRAARVLRGVALFDRRRQVLLQDEVTAREPSEVWWFLHTRAAIQLLKEGKVALLKQGERQLAIRLLAPDPARFSIMSARPLPSSPDPAGQRSNEEVRKLAVRLEGVTKECLAIQFMPIGPGFSADAPSLRESIALSQAVRVVPLADWRDSGNSKSFLS